ncbi:PAS domain S-box protein [candidate division KSB1 bacterium]|nr:PAS domain S-box protein [candidate division KSB1 bacterium]
MDAQLDWFEFVKRIPPGMHLCVFYQNQADLVEILLPYYQEGIKKHELCIWIAAEPLNPSDTQTIFLKKWPESTNFLKNGQLVIISHQDWYLKEKKFNGNKVTELMLEKLNFALESGYHGLRISGNAAWLKPDNWDDFIRFEENINQKITNSPVIALCAYPLDNYRISEMLEVFSQHQATLLKRSSTWKLIEGVGYRRILEKLSRLSSVVEAMVDGVIIIDLDGKINYVNQAICTTLDYLPNQLLKRSLLDLVSEVDRVNFLSVMSEVIKNSAANHLPELRIRHRNDYEISMSITFSMLRNMQDEPNEIILVARDITINKQAMEALAHEQNLLQTLMDNIPDHIYFKDIESRFIRINRAQMRWFGLDDIAKVLEKTDFDFFAEEHARQAFEDEQQIIRTGEPVVGIEEKESWPDGKDTWVSTTKMPLRNQQGEIIGTFGISRDITEHKRAEAALKASEEKYRSIFENIRDVYYETSLDGIILEISPSVEELSAYTREELIGSSLSDLYAIPEKRAELIKLLLEKNNLPDYEVALRDKNGRLVYTSLNVKIIKDLAGNPLKIVGSLRDITERKRTALLLETLNTAALAMEHALTPEEIFNAVATHLQKLGFVTTLFLLDETQKKLEIKFISQQNQLVDDLTNLLGFSPLKFSIPIEASSFFHHTIYDRQTQYIDSPTETIQQLLPPTLLDPALKLLDQYHLTRFIRAPLIIDEQVIGMLSVFSDDLSENDLPSITAFANQMAAAWRKSRLMQELVTNMQQLKETQVQLLHSQKMEAIGRLAGGVAHDFNNLLTAITGYTELLIDSIPFEAPMQADLKEIKKAADRAAALTRQLLAFSRRQPLQTSITDLNNLVINMQKLLKRLLGEDIELITMLDPALARVKVDQGQIEQVLMNLAVNARDAMPEGGMLTIKTENIILEENSAEAIKYAHNGKFIRMSISDTGMGIEKNMLEKIFDPFFSTKGPGEGTGLGLSVVYGIIQQHEGWIHVTSESNQGAIFEIFLPAFSIEAESELEEKNILAELRGNGERILLIEDEEMIGKFATRILNQNGYLVFSATSFREAQELFMREQGNFDLIFSDVVLPDGSGLHLVEQLLLEKPNLKVLLSSGYTDQKSQWRQIRGRGFRFLQKPYVFTTLLEIIKEILKS